MAPASNSKHENQGAVPSDVLLIKTGEYHALSVCLATSHEMKDFKS
jgi:hypothetical protein